MPNFDVTVLNLTSNLEDDVVVLCSCSLAESLGLLSCVACAVKSYSTENQLTLFL